MRLTFRRGLRLPPSLREDVREGEPLPGWYILRRLREELARSRRYYRPLSIFLAAPKLLPGERLAPSAVAAATVAAVRTARTTDLVGKLDEGTFLIVMPETRQEETAAALARWRNQWLRPTASGDQVWNVVSFEVEPDMDAQELIQLARAELRLERTPGLFGRRPAKPRAGA